MSDLLPYIEIGPQQADYSVIWLHGLGADGHDFEPIVSELDLPKGLTFRFIFPHAPQRPVTINNGYVMRAWFDISEIKIDAQQDEKGIHESAQQLTRLIENEIAQGIPSEKIFLAGFSQGGAIALHTGLRYSQKIAGILALSTFLPLANSLANEANEANQATPIMFAHGEQDPVIPITLAQQSQSFLTELGYSIDWHVYPMQHTVSAEEIRAISQWLSQCVG